MPAIHLFRDGCRCLRLRVFSGLNLTVLLLLASVAAAAESSSNVLTVGYDPFEVAMPTVSGFAAEGFAAQVPQTPPNYGTNDAQQIGRGHARLTSDEQLPGLPPSAAPGSQASAENVSLRPIYDLTTNIQLPSGMLPRDYWGEHPQPGPFFFTCGTNRGWPFDNYNWLPTCLCYQPLYFEEPNLERYGYGCGCYTCCGSTCVQSACSAAHFFATVPALPYMMAANCPCECNYALGDYRPGSCPPWRYQCCAPCTRLWRRCRRCRGLRLDFDAAVM